MMKDRDTLIQNVEALKRLPAEVRFDTLTKIALATGGFAHTPENANTWDSQNYELKAQGVFAFGTTPDECVRMWIKCAGREADRLQGLIDAEAILGVTGPIEAWRLRQACKTILADSRDAEIRRLATQELAQLDAVAA